MKKCLVLVMVLGIASMATAGLTLTAPAEVNAGQAFTVVVSGLAADIPANGTVYGSLFTDGLADDDGAYASLAAVGDVVLQWDFLAAYGTYDFEISAGLVDITVDGAWIQLDFVAGAAGEIYNMNMTDESFVGSLDSATITVVPEPMTMGLLGLGGLFLRRRK